MSTCFAASAPNCTASSPAPPILSSARTSKPLRFCPELEALGERVVPATATWRGMFSTDADDHRNWSGIPYGTLPGQYDHLLFTAQPTGGMPPTMQSAPNCDGLDGTFSSIEFTSAYTNTVTFEGAVTTGFYIMFGGAIAQANDTRNLTVTSTFTWNGGVLNNTPSTAYVNVNGGGTIAPSGGVLTSGSTISFGSSGGEKTTTITGGGTIFLTGANQEGMEVKADAKVQLNTDPNLKSWIKSESPKTLTLLDGSKGWTYSGTGEAECEYRVINQGGLFKLDGATHVKLTGGNGGAMPLPSYRQVEIASAWLHINNGSNLEVSHGATIHGGSIFLIMNATSSTATLTGKLTMMKGDIVFSGPIGTGANTTYGKFKVVGDVTWSGGTYRPCIDTDGVKANLWEVTGTLTVDMSDPIEAKRPLIEPGLAPGQQYTGTWPVIEATGLGSIQGGPPRVPIGWNLLTTTDGGGVKRKFSLNK